MYSWSDDTSDWYGPEKYNFDATTKETREKAAARASASGPRAYGQKSSPILDMVNPKRKIRSESKNPIIVAVDVTGSMSTWPAEIFDRLPLLYSTLQQYRSDLEICFVAIGDARSDSYPLQVTDFAHGYDLEQLLKAIYGEGGGGDGPEDYQLLPYFLKTRVELPNAEQPFLIVFGDAPMHKKLAPFDIEKVFGDKIEQDLSSVALWQETATRFNTWFLRRPTGSRNDDVDKQWFEAIGPQQVVRVHDEQRAIDYALGIVARSWGKFDDFKQNLAARQAKDKVSEFEAKLAEVKPRVLKCPNCGGHLPPVAFGRWVCGFCKATLDL